MAQAVQTRDGTKAGWRLPRLRIRVNPTKAGVFLALTAWLLQAYAETVLVSRERLAHTIQLTEVQREMWLVEYNSSLTRPATPNNRSVTARAAFEVVRNTHELLALADIAQGGLFVRSGPILAEAQKKNDLARELFDAHDYRQLVGQLQKVSQVCEQRIRERTIDPPSQAGVVSWFQHALPAVFLVGMLLCLKGRRDTATDD